MKMQSVIYFIVLQCCFRRIRQPQTCLTAFKEWFSSKTLNTSDDPPVPILSTMVYDFPLMWSSFFDDEGRRFDDATGVSCSFRGERCCWGATCNNQETQNWNFSILAKINFKFHCFSLHQNSSELSIQGFGSAIDSCAVGSGLLKINFRFMFIA